MTSGDESQDGPEGDDGDEWSGMLAPRDPFHRELNRLKSLTKYQRRGYDFQNLVASLFKFRHFMVRLDPGTSRPRQTDLLATRGNSVYLIETKWRRDRANIDDVDSLYTRLDSAPVAVVGVLISYSGFTDSVIKRVEERSDRPILLLDGQELERIIQREEDIARVLDQKKAYLLTHRRVFSGPGTGLRERSISGGLPVSDIELVLLDGNRPKSIAGKGEFGQFVYTQELPDIDWEPGDGRGVALDMHVSVYNQDGVLNLLRHLSDMGWTTGSASWSIQQMSINWHGFGASEFADTLADWRGRYQGKSIHNSEEFCYFDKCDGGFYSLTSDISAYEDRSAHYAVLSFQLSGVPLETESFKQLAETFDVGRQLYFRPMSARSVRRRWNIPAEYRLQLSPLAYIVGRDRLFDDGLEWASGIVAINPFHRKESMLGERLPEWLPDYVFDSELVICNLRSYHPLSKPKSRYELWGCEWARTAEAVVVRLVAEWPDRG